MKPPQYVSIPGSAKKHSSETRESKATICILFSLFLYAFFSITGNLHAEFIIFLPLPMHQKYQDGHIPFLPPIRDGSDLSFPSELASSEAIVILEPTMGSHKYNDDAIFTVAEGIELEALALFVTTLRDSGFEGDIVLSVLPREQMAPGLFDFLEYHSKRGLVFYEGAVEFEESPYQHYTNNTKVYLKGMYGDNNTKHVFEDPRKNRDISGARFELYWIWSLRYSPISKILLIDAKDTYFQRSNETAMGVGMACPLRNSSELHLYEGLIETREVIDKAMIPTAYSKEIFDLLSKMKIIIPSSTHGDQVAIEVYLRAMVKQFDYTQCAESACEWAWHNYLYYFGSLQGAPSIDNITLAMHGTGSVHIVADNEIIRSQYEGNETQGVYNYSTGVLYNRRMGNGFHSSWAIHRYDRDPTLKASIDLKAKKIISDLDYDSTSVPFIVEPTMGTHRKDVNAIFSVGDDLSLEALSLFVMSARKTGFDGDIVLSVSKRDHMPVEVYEFLVSQISYGLVVYEGAFSTEDYYVYSSSHVRINGLYSESKYGEARDDLRPARSWKVARFELFMAWSQRYSDFSRILLLQADDSYFQGNPFKDEFECNKNLELNFFKMSKMTMRFEDMQLYYPEVANAFEFVLDEDVYEIVDERILTPNAIQGHQRAIYRYLQDMLRTIDRSQCYDHGCDWAVHNYLWYFVHVPDGLTDFITKSAHNQGNGVVNTIMSSVSMMQHMKILRNGDHFFNWDNKPSVVVINFKDLWKLQRVFDWRRREYISEIGANMTRNNYKKFLRSSLSIE